MLLNIEPTITGTFVHIVMEDAAVKGFLETIELSDTFKHNMVKAIMIATTKELEYDSNRAIKKAVSKSLSSE